MGFTRPTVFLQLALDVLMMLVIFGGQFVPFNPMWGYIRKLRKTDFNGRRGYFFNNKATEWNNLVTHYFMVFGGNAFLVLQFISKITRKSVQMEQPWVLTTALATSGVVLIIYFLEWISSDGFLLLFDDDKFPSYAAKLVSYRTRPVQNIVLIVSSLISVGLLGFRAYYLFTLLVQIPL